MKKISRILIIEDDPMTSYLHRKLIESYKVADNIDIAADGEEAIDLISSSVQANEEDKIPQLIFVDLDMPFMDGFQFLEAFQNLTFKNKNKVVIAVLTSSMSSSDMNRAKRQSVDAYIMKPMTKEKMMELMEDHFGWQLKQV